MVQQRLGHADVSVTLGLYTHVLPGHDQDAANAFGTALGESRCDQSVTREPRSGARVQVRVVRPLGFEPRTCGLRVRCSAIELEAPGVTEGTRTPDFRDHNAAL